MYSLATILAGLGALALAVQGTGFPSDQVLRKREPHPAVLSSPKEGAVLALGGQVRVKFTDGETAATTVSVRLSNSTFSHTLASNLDFKNYRIDVSLPLPNAKTLAPGAYHLKIFEGKGEVGGSVEVRLAKKKSKRAPHPAGITSPLAGSVFAPGGTFQLEFHDGETDADQIQLVLKKSDGSQTYTLGTAPFTAFAAQGSFTIPDDAVEGSYSLAVQENGSGQESTFTDAFSENVFISKSGSPASLSEIAASTPSLLSGPPRSSTPSASSPSSPSAPSTTPTVAFTSTTSSSTPAATTPAGSPSAGAQSSSASSRSSTNAAPTTGSTSDGGKVDVQVRWVWAIVGTGLGIAVGMWFGI